MTQLSLRHLLLGLLALCLATVTLSAQSVLPVAAAVENFKAQGGTFSSLQLWSPEKELDRQAAEFAQGAQFLALDLSQLRTILDVQPEALVFDIPYNGETVTVELLKVQVTSADFTVLTNLSNGQNVGYTPGLHYRGAIRGDGRSLAAFSFFEGDVMGLVSDDLHGDMVLGKLDIPRNANGYIFYEDNRLSKKHPFSCEVLYPDKPAPVNQGGNPEVNGCVRVYYEADNELYVNKGSVQNTVSYLTGVFNQVATLYANETISTVLSQVYVWVSADSYSNSSSSTALTQFQGARPYFNADLAHLVSLGGANIGGVAWVDVICNSTYHYAYSNIYSTYSTVPTYSWTVEVLTHEMGHNLGSNHTQWCGWTGGALDNCYTTEGGCAAGPPPTNGGTIMSYCHLTSYGINFNNGFGTQPGNKIRTQVSSAACLSASCSSGNGCNAPTAISVSNITTGQATITWTAVSGATGYNLQWRQSGTSTWTTVSNAASPATITGLPGPVNIEVQLQSICGSLTSEYVNGVIFTSAANAGCADAYEPNNSRTAAKVIPVNTLFTAKIASSTDVDWYRFSNTTATPKIKVEMTNLPADFDMKLYRNTTLVGTSQNAGLANELIIYNTTTVANNYYVNVYGYNGAFHATSCYSLKVSLSATNWVLGVDDREEGVVTEIPVNFIDLGFGLYPNPAKDAVTVDVPVETAASDVTISLTDVTGKMLHQQQAQATADTHLFNLDVHNLNAGIYFVQVRNGEKMSVRKLVVNK